MTAFVRHFQFTITKNREIHTITHYTTEARIKQLAREHFALGWNVSEICDDHNLVVAPEMVHTVE